MFIIYEKNNKMLLNTGDDAFDEGGFYRLVRGNVNVRYPKDSGFKLAMLSDSYVFPEGNHFVYDEENNCLNPIEIEEVIEDEIS